MEKQKFNIKETLLKLVEDTKNDKKKMFFVIFIPLLLLASIIIGIVMSGDENIVDNSEENNSLIVPVDSLGSKKVNKSDVYKRDFFAVGEEKNDSVEFFNENNVEDKPEVIQKTGSSSSNNVRTYSNYKKQNSVSNYNVSTKTPVVSNDELVETNKSSSKRRRLPTDGSGNLGYGNSKSKADMYRGVVANENKIVKSGVYVKIRIPEAIEVDNLILPANSVVSGITSMAGERLKVDINSVRIGSQTRSVKWTVYDEDGNLGIAIPASILNDISRDGANDLAEESGSKVEANVPVVGNVKVNLKRKMTEVSFVIPNGHRLYIKEVK